MVMDPIPILEDLVWLFEVEPVGDSEQGWQEYWPYSSVSFTTLRDDYDVMFSINPGYEDVGITLSRDDQALLTLTLSRVESVGVERLHGAEELVLRFRDSNLAPLRLQLKPLVSVMWGMHLYPPEL